jgi:hypothetical protein
MLMIVRNENGMYLSTNKAFDRTFLSAEEQGVCVCVCVCVSVSVSLSVSASMCVCVVCVNVSPRINMCQPLCRDAFADF